MGQDKESWSKINKALRDGLRGLPGGTTLARLLWKTARQNRSKLTEGQILKWAEDWKKGQGKWPGLKSGEISGTNESWIRIDYALRYGSRGLPGGSSLPRLLESVGRKNSRNRPQLTESLILKWAIRWKKDHKVWPGVKLEKIPGTDETWSGIDNALRDGYKGLPGGSGLPNLLESVGRKRKGHPRLTEKQILEWAKEWERTHETRPTLKGGMIPGTNESWIAINEALLAGSRGLPGGKSLMEFLGSAGFKSNGHRSVRELGELTEGQILGWAKEWKNVHGEWPLQKSGAIPKTGETWGNLDSALRGGKRGLPSGRGLAGLLELVGRKSVQNLPRLTEGQILGWAKKWKKVHGKWPSQISGAVPKTDETWGAINGALRSGRRGLPGGSSLSLLLHSTQ